MHQDIAPRKLLIDPDTPKIFHFDFDRAACRKKGLLDGREDVMGVVFHYTRSSRTISSSRVPTGIDTHWDRNMDMVQSISEWPCNRELDADVSTFRNFLNEWVATRQPEGDMDRYLNAPNRLTWPDQPTAPDYNVPFELGQTSDGETIWGTGRGLDAL